MKKRTNKISLRHDISKDLPNGSIEITGEKMLLLLDFVRIDLLVTIEIIGGK